MNVERAINSRRSVRSYNSKMVEDDKLKQVLMAGNNAPSAMNNQSRTFIAITSASVKTKLNEAVKKSSSEETVKRITGRSKDGSFNFFYNAPVLIVVASSDKLYPEADCACSIQNMYLRALDLGLGACWINQIAKTDNEEVLRVLHKVGLDSGSTVYGCLALGYTDVKTAENKIKKNKIVIVK